MLVTMLAAALATNGRSAVTHDDDDRRDGKKRNLEATLSGFNEVPAVSTAARGSFKGRISRDGDRIEWRLEYRDMSAPVTQAHIHLGAHHTNGGVSVFLCSNLGNGPSGTKECPNGPGRHVITGTSSAVDVVGPSNQGIAAMEFAELIRAIRAGRTYANVHTDMSGGFPGGEIRGQIKVDD